MVASILKGGIPCIIDKIITEETEVLTMHFPRVMPFLGCVLSVCRLSLAFQYRFSTVFNNLQNIHQESQMITGPYINQVCNRPIIANPTHTVPLYAKEIDIYENEKPALDDEDDDSEIEDIMALETFYELSFNTQTLSVQSFIEWEDIQDVISRGFVDQETIRIILKEVGVKSGFMTFAQFKDVVELVNQVNSALEHNSLHGDDEEENDNESDSDDNSSQSDEGEDDDTIKWLNEQLNRMESKSD